MLCYIFKKKYDKDAFLFTFIFFFITLLLFVLNSILGIIGLFLTVSCLLFFRDPDRFVPKGDNIIVSPADGVVVKTELVKTPEYLDIKDNEVLSVSIFLSVFDVHVNRIPISGVINKIIYTPGKFLNASLDEADVNNEKNIISMVTTNGYKVAFEQIAGLIARRIRTDVVNGEVVGTGQRFGLIRFGSRMTLFFPKAFKLNICKGQTVIGGETIIARIKEKDAEDGLVSKGYSQI